MTSTGASNEVEGAASGHSTEMHEATDDQNVQLNSDNVERDALAITREKRLLMMFKCSILTAFVCVLAIVVGLLAIFKSDSVPYNFGGGLIAGGMVLLMTICPICMFFEGKKTRTGTKMTTLFKCNLICMMVWFSFTLCGIFLALGIPGIWGMVECLKEKKKTKQNSIGLCVDHTNEKLIFSVSTVVLSSVLLLLTLVINCLFCCNTKAFGYKTIRRRRHEFYRNIIEREMQLEQREQRINEMDNQARVVDRHDGYRTNRQDDNTRERQDNYANNERNYPREPSAPPLEDYTKYRDNRGQQNRRPPPRSRDHPGERIEAVNYPRRSPESRNHSRTRDDYSHHSRRPDDDRRYQARRDDDRQHRRRPDDDRRHQGRRDDDRPHPANEDRYRQRRSHDNDGRQSRQESNNSGDVRGINDGQVSRYINIEDGNKRERKSEDDSEVPPPSYNEVVNKYLKADDV